MDIGTRVEMFIDRHLIHEMSGCCLKINQPVRMEKVMVFDRPWESDTSGYITVINDNGLIRMYYRGITESPDGVSGAVTCCACSRDGITFERPASGLFEFNGSRDNNIILKGVPEAHNFTPFLDSNPLAHPSMRYKAVGGHEHTGANKGRLFGLYSDDGIMWHRFSDEPLMTDGMFDSQNVAFFDNNTGMYRCYARYFENSGLENPAPYKGIRAIKSFVSLDFIHWTEAGNNLYDVPATEEFYTNATLCCPGAGHHYLSFPKRFMPGRNRDFFTGADGVSDAVFMSSRDGMHWDRTFMEAWVRPGLDRKNWVNRNNMPALGIIDTGENEFSMYISENYRTPTSGIRRLSIRKFGFASVHAGSETGYVVTKPLEFGDHPLQINYSTSAAGHIKALIIGSDGPILDESGIIYGDEIFEEVVFNKPAGFYKGRELSLRFELRDADLYAIRFGEV